MFVRQPQFRNASADVQIFYGVSSANTPSYGRMTWNKPPGVSHVYILLIGAGGNSTTSAVGASGAVTVWYGAAQIVPDVLFLRPSVSNSVPSAIWPNSSTAEGSPLLFANAGTTTAGAAMSSNNFAASGFFRSVAGHSGNSTTGFPSATTFLSGGVFNTGSGATNTANYGVGTTGAGYFQLQPIIVGVGGAGTSSVAEVGCGAGASASGAARGGRGMILIASW